MRVHAAGLNGGDMMQRRGLYPAPPGLPQDIPGMEFAGEVAALGPGAERFEVGRPCDGDRRRRRAGRARRRARAHPDAGARRRSTGPPRAACRRSSRPPTTRSSPRPGCGPASACSCTAAPAASARPRSSSRRAAGARVTATVRDEELREQVAALGATAIAPEDFAERGPVRRDPRAGRRAEHGGEHAGARRPAGGSA